MIFLDDLPSAENFTSVLSLTPADYGVDHSRVHVIYGASKDWGSNGLRVGALISQRNSELHTAMQSSCLLMKISSVSDALWSSLLMNRVELPIYLRLNQQALADAYTLATTWLKKHSIPYRASNAGHFIMIDLRKWLPSHLDGYAAEEELSDMLNRNGVNLVSIE